METQFDELTDTGVLRYQEATDLATARFVSHLMPRELTTEELAALAKAAA
jgi:hypothetical protein